MTTARHPQTVKVFDMRNQTAELAVDLIESLFGKSTLMRTVRC